MSEADSDEVRILASLAGAVIASVEEQLGTHWDGGSVFNGVLLHLADGRRISFFAMSLQSEGCMGVEELVEEETR